MYKASSSVTEEDNLNTKQTIEQQIIKTNKNMGAKDLNNVTVGTENIKKETHRMTSYLLP
jgi:hypothetical protein